MAWAILNFVSDIGFTHLNSGKGPGHSVCVCWSHGLCCENGATGLSFLTESAVECEELLLTAVWDWFCAGRIKWAKRFGITSSSRQLHSLKLTFQKKSWISWRRSLNFGILWISEFLAKILFQITCHTTSIIMWPCGQSKGELGCDAGKAAEFAVLLHLLMAFGLYYI